MSILLTPARIGGVEIKNRIVMPPMTTRTADDDGCVTEDTIAYYVARAEGGVGLIPTAPDNTSLRNDRPSLHVMAGLVPAIHALLAAPKTWMAGTRPAMTSQGL